MLCAGISTSLDANGLGKLGLKTLQFTTLPWLTLSTA